MKMGPTPEFSKGPGGSSLEVSTVLEDNEPMERSTIAIMLVLANAAIAIWIVVAWPEQFCLDPLPGQSSAPCIGTSVGELIRAPIVVATIVNAILVSMLIKSPRR